MISTCRTTDGQASRRFEDRPCSWLCSALEFAGDVGAGVRGLRAVGPRRVVGARCGRRICLRRGASTAWAWGAALAMGPAASGVIPPTSSASRARTRVAEHRSSRVGGRDVARRHVATVPGAPSSGGQRSWTKWSARRRAPSCSGLLPLSHCGGLRQSPARAAGASRASAISVHMVPVR